MLFLCQLALSAASPVHRGYLTDRDCRWNIISASVDDRTDEEQGIEVLNTFGINFVLFVVAFCCKIQCRIAI